MLFLAGAEKELKFHTDIQLNTFKKLQGKKETWQGFNSIHMEERRRQT